MSLPVVVESHSACLAISRCMNATLWSLAAGLRVTINSETRYVRFREYLDPIIEDLMNKISVNKKV